MPPKRRFRLTEEQLDRRIRLLERAIEIEDEKARRQGRTPTNTKIDVGPTEVGSVIRWDGAHYVIEAITDDGISLIAATPNDISLEQQG